MAEPKKNNLKNTLRDNKPEKGNKTKVTATPAEEKKGLSEKLANSDFY
jgi:hypothetical protein